MQDTHAWSGRFSEPVSELVKKYTASVTFDNRLAEFDIEGSLAHAAMLNKSGVLSDADLAAIRDGMAQIIADIRAGNFDWSVDLEDVHMNVEKRLTDKIGDAGKRLHTGRSRNDQVATDIRLYLRDAIDHIVTLIAALQTSLLDLAEQHADTVMPGFTHLQVAQPVTFGHHMLAYVEMLAATASAWWIAASASTACRWAPPRWLAPLSRWIVFTPPSCWGLTTSVTTRWMRCPTVTLPSNSPPPLRW